MLLNHVNRWQNVNKRKGKKNLGQKDDRKGGSFSLSEQLVTNRKKGVKNEVRNRNEKHPENRHL